MAGNDDILEQVMDVLEGRVQGDAAHAVLDRIATEPAWQQAHAWATEFLAVSASSTLQTPPPSTRTMLEGLLPARPTFADSVGDVVRDAVRDAIRSFATLLRDVPAGAAFAGARGAGTRRQLLFGIVDGTDLAIELDVLADRILISGQLLGPDPAGTIDVIGTDAGETGTSGTVRIDELGEFAIDLAATSFLRLDLTTTNHRTSVDLTPFLDAPDQES